MAQLGCQPIKVDRAAGIIQLPDGDVENRPSGTSGSTHSAMTDFATDCYANGLAF